ncbi:germin-like protein subfamily 3 member 4 [Eucalyptus grandis]|uniref:germin-like protein subfamily 3 member 4 n=1 Tax=Eucalyptus grandis TaxID=71139 RepID=UPI00192EAF90|nr:germin-like protein subfamily 3 member 4 [Eucalyptus grandis]
MNPNRALNLLPFVVSTITFFNGFAVADHENLQDMCPTTTSTVLFMNGYPCKSSANISASDFKSSKLSIPGDTDNFYRSAVTMATAADFPGLNTLGLSIARADMEVDSMVLLHLHPRSAEMMYVLKGVVIAGFIDTDTNLFQKQMREGEVMVIPRGLLHFCLNDGFEVATVFSVLNSQNPGSVSIAGAMLPFQPNSDDEDVVNKLRTRLIASSMGNPLRG